MSGDVQVRFCESLRVRFLRATRLLILCSTKRQLQRCKQRMMAVLKERSLRLSRKKTRIGRIELGFHFLGIHYPGTQTPDNTKVEQAVNRAVIQVGIAQYIPLLSVGGADIATNNQTPALDRIVPHPRTLRKAREQVKQMVIESSSHLPLLGGSPLRTERATFTALRSSSHKAE